MNKHWLAFFLVMMFCLLKTAYAESHFSCTPLPLKSQDKMLILPGVSDSHATQIYFLQNNAPQSLWLDHSDKAKHSAHAGWSSYLRAGKWSALLLNRKNFSINCAEIQPGKVNYQDCAKSITVCVPQNIEFDSKRKGSYWLAEDQSWDELLNVLKKRGVKFK